jgi:hypothetical protein
MAQILFMEDRKPGVHAYTPEMGQRKPACKMEATLGHYGRHYYIDTTETLTGRGIEHLQTYRERDLTAAGRYKIGWNRYKVTVKAFEAIKAHHPVSMASHLD